MSESPEKNIQKEQETEKRKDSASAPLLEIRGLHVSFQSRGKKLRAVRGIDLKLAPGEILGLVGESGSGKSVAMKAVMNLLPENARVEADSIRLDHLELLSLSETERRKLCGKSVSMIFQDPMTSLDPLMNVGGQLAEVLRRNAALRTKTEIRERSLDILKKVGIPAPEERLRQYPHELSGGMRQRILIAMALCSGPKLLIADEPTTALDVTIQAQILSLLDELRKEFQSSIILITHDMGVVASICQRIAILYGGLIMESGSAEDIFYHAGHPYTRALLRAVPGGDIEEGKRLLAIEGSPPSLMELPKGCPFAPRCERAKERCFRELPGRTTLGEGHELFCHNP